MTAQTEVTGAAEAPPPRPTLVRRWLASIFRLAWLAGGVATVAMLFIVIAPGPWPMCLLTPFVPQWTVLAFLSWAVVVLGQQHKRQFRRVAIGGMTLITLAAVAGVVLLNRGVVRGAAEVRPGGGGPTLTVMAANVHSSNADHDSLPRLILAEQPDVVLLTEITSNWLASVDRQIATAYPYHRASPDDAGNFGMGIWSKTKLLDADFEFFKPDDPTGLSDTPQLVTTIALDDAPHTRVRIFGIHPLPPMHGYAQRARDTVLHNIADRVAAEPDVPTILLGDFNATPYCRVIRDLADTAGVADATLDLRVTWPHVWSWPVMGIHIDHIFVSDRFAVETARVGADIGSDHWPVLAKLHLVEPTVQKRQK